MRESRGGGGGGVVGGAWEKLGQSQGPDFSQKKKRKKKPCMLGILTKAALSPPNSQMAAVTYFPQRQAHANLMICL